MRRRAVIMKGKRPAGLVRGPDRSEIAAFRGIAAERPAFHLRFDGGRLDCNLAAALAREAVRPETEAGKIVGGEFPDRQPVGKTRGERIRRIVVLMATLEGRHPQRLRCAFRDRRIERGRRHIEIAAQVARRRFAKRGRLQPEQSRRFLRLGAPAPHPPSVARALPWPERRALRHPGRQVEHEDPRAGCPGAHRGNAAGNDLVIGMRRQNEDPAHPHQTRLSAAARHTGSKSSASTSAQLGTRAST